MATVNFIAFKHHLKDNGQINVKLCVYHKGKRIYFSTKHNVVLGQLKKDYSFKDKDLIATLNIELAGYMRKISNLGEEVDQMTAKELKDKITSVKVVDDTKIDFIAFSRSYIAQIKESGKTSSAGKGQAVINNLIDFIKSDFNSLYTNNITSEMLRAFEKYLRKPHKQTRLNQFKKPVTVIRAGMGDVGVFNHMKDFRLLFNAARSKYNNLDTGEIKIPNYPFHSYKLTPPADPEPKAQPISVVKAIRDLTLTRGSRAELGRDMFMLSFCLLGVNAKDIYLLEQVKSGRVSYNRSKTSEKRTDKAFISVKAIPEAVTLLDRYIGVLQKRYSTDSIFRKAIAEGLKQVAVMVGVERLGFYDARHTVGTEARNTLGFSVADVGEALNHRRAESRITDAYIKKNWSKIDEIQAGVVALLGTV